MSRSRTELVSVRQGGAAPPLPREVRDIIDSAGPGKTTVHVVHHRKPQPQQVKVVQAPSQKKVIVVQQASQPAPPPPPPQPQPQPVTGPTVVHYPVPCQVMQPTPPPPIVVPAPPPQQETIYVKKPRYVPVPVESGPPPIPQPPAIMPVPMAGPPMLEGPVMDPYGPMMDPYGPFIDPYPVEPYGPPMDPYGGFATGFDHPVEIFGGPGYFDDGPAYGPFMPDVYDRFGPDPYGYGGGPLGRPKAGIPMLEYY